MSGLNYEQTARRPRGDFLTPSLEPALFEIGIRRVY